MDTLSTEQVALIKKANVEGFTNQTLAAGKDEATVVANYKRASAKATKFEKIASTIRDSLK